MSETDRSRSHLPPRLVAAWRRGEPATSVGFATVLALVARLPFLGVPVYPDEGGYLLVARHWDTAGPYLYGDFFVDRPPLLLAVFRLADALGGITALRLIASLFVSAMVVSAGWAGWTIASLRGARWAALVAAALASSPLLGTAETDGEILAAPLVVLSCALLLAASRPRRPLPPVRGLWYAASAGLVAMAAVLVKQNFVDALVFGAVLLALGVARHDLPRPTARRMLAGFAGGAAVPALGVALWATGWGPGVADLWFSLYGFRWQALGVIESQGLTPQSRLDALFVLSLESGMASLGAVFVVAQRRALRRLDPVNAAVAVMLGVAVTGVALGGSYWSHYLIQVVPALALAAACLAARAGGTVAWAKGAVAFAAAATLVSVLVVARPSAEPSETVALENWLQAAAKPSDSVFSNGHANVIEASGLRPPSYPYLWGLPMLVLDPRWTQLDSVLDGPHAPTWVVEWSSFSTFGASGVAGVRAAIAAHYRLAADLCGHPVYLLDTARRSLPHARFPCDVP